MVLPFGNEVHQDALPVLVDHTGLVTARVKKILCQEAHGQQRMLNRLINKERGGLQDGAFAGGN